jgi:hypothetical protein
MHERRAGRCVALGVGLQALGAGGLAWLIAWQSRREGALGEVTKYTVRLAWHDALHHGRLLGLVASCVVVYLIGAVCMAHPFVTSRAELLIAVPLTALIGLFLLGAFAVVVALAVALMYATDGEGGDLAFDGVKRTVEGLRRAIRSATRVLLRRTR